ncbi:MAG TPA: hypothetical protein DEB39_12740 [Planctomycetaceae bacterium]|nr:hypothetical protein [Planctomycetaceae bacterium]
MFTQIPPKDIFFSDDQEIQDLFDRLGIDTEDQREREANPRKSESWPPIPTYSVKFCSDEKSSW